MTEEIIALRPHHIAGFASYYHNGDRPLWLGTRYGEEFPIKVLELYEHIISGGNKDEYILVINHLDTLCDICPAKHETCKEPDGLSLEHSGGWIMQMMNLREGFLYPIPEFMGKIRALHATN